MEQAYARVQVKHPWNEDTSGLHEIRKTADLFVCFSDSVTPSPATIAIQVIIGVVDSEERAILACYSHARRVLNPQAWNNLQGPYSYAPYEWFMEAPGYDEYIGHHRIRFGFRRAGLIEVVEPLQENGGSSNKPGDEKTRSIDPSFAKAEHPNLGI